jgi:hypothetical protein
MTDEKKPSRFQIYENVDLVNSEQYISEQFKSKITLDDNNTGLKSQFMEKVGEPHPFDYSIIEGVAKKFGLITAILNKIRDYALGPGIFVDSENEEIVDILEEWIDKTDYKSFLNAWFEEALMKGTGYQEIAGLSSANSTNEIKVVNSNTMYIKRDDKGNIKKYNQFIGSNMNQIKDEDIIQFNPTEIIQLDINKIGSCAYGMGIVFSALSIINDFLSAQKCMHKIMERKANNPIHAKLGNIEKDDYPQQEDIDAFGKKLQYMNSTTEWVTGPNVEMVVLDFGKISDKFQSIMDNDMKLLSYAFQVPESVMGGEKSYTGASESHDDGFDRIIKSYQEQIAFVIKTKVFNRVLENNGIFDRDYKIIWGKPGEKELVEMRTSIQGLLALGELSPGMRLAYEKKLAILDGIDYDEVETENRKAERKENRMQKKEFNQQVQIKATPPGKAPPVESIKDRILDEFLLNKAPQEIECTLMKEFNLDAREAYIKVNEELDEIEKDFELEDWVGEYTQTKKDILDVIENDKFENLAAKKVGDIKLGLLNKKQIEKVKEVFSDAFENKLSLKKIEAKLAKIGLRDRYVMKDGEKVLSMTADKRPHIIARTETVRLRAEGSLLAYENKDIKEVMFNVNSVHPCPDCSELDGSVYPLEVAHSIIPRHVGCRCNWSEVREI